MVTQGGAATPLTLGYDVKPLRGTRLTASLLIDPNLELLNLVFQMKTLAAIMGFH